MLDDILRCLYYVIILRNDVFIYLHLIWVQDVIEKSFDDNLAEDSNMDEYVTATECSITPTIRSRSESFVTSPEWEDLAAPTSVARTCCDTG